eukprot:scaffold2911_cov414-Prasinococcus_capsulatus_cf.AAC.34
MLEPVVARHPTGSPAWPHPGPVTPCARRQPLFSRRTAPRCKPRARSSLAGVGVGALALLLLLLRRPPGDDRPPAQRDDAAPGGGEAAAGLGPLPGRGSIQG